MEYDANKPPDATAMEIAERHVHGDAFWQRKLASEITTAIQAYSNHDLDKVRELRAEYDALWRVVHGREETQQSILEWTLNTFGQTNPRHRAAVLLEEVIELCLACGLEDGIMRAVLERVIARDAQPPNAELRHQEIVDETGDVGITLYALAETLGVDVRVAIEKKMAGNRTRDVARMRAKHVAKTELYGLVGHYFIEGGTE